MKIKLSTSLQSVEPPRLTTFHVHSPAEAFIISEMQKLNPSTSSTLSSPSAKFQTLKYFER